MGINNRQRRAAKKSKRSKNGAGHPGRGPGEGYRGHGQGGYGVGHGYGPGGYGQDGYGPGGYGPGGYGQAGYGRGGNGAPDYGRDRASAPDGGRDVAASLVLRALAELATDPRAARRYAEEMVAPHSPVPKHVLADVLGLFLTDLTTAVVKGGWSPSDLGEIMRRRGSGRHLPPLAGLLAAETERHRPDRVSPAWRQDLEGLGSPEPLDLASALGLELGLGLAAVMRILPDIAPTLPRPGSVASMRESGASGTDSKQLAKVRSLLAKAESTQYPEEAEALSAKAQELISRYALDRLLEQAEDSQTGGSVTLRRLWIDPPYVLAKATLIGEVANANRCRSIVSEQLGFCAIVGDPSDLHSVEVMTTSLLVQANTAIQRHGSHVDSRGTTRTRSFRQSFLVSYALRIGERLRAADQEAVAETERTDLLLPALRSQEEHVEAAFAEIFPNAVSRQTSITNSVGWAAGRAAADLALFDLPLPLASAAGGGGRS